MLFTACQLAKLVLLSGRLEWQNTLCGCPEMRISAQRLAAMATVAAAAKPSKVYVVTGATDGIGRLTAQKLGSDGLHVAVHGRTKSKVDAVVAEVEQGGGTARGFVADLSSMKDVRRLGAEIAEAYDRIDGLLNNAGTFSGDYTGKRVVTDEGNEYSLAVNVLAPFLLTSLLLDRVRASGNGRILVTSSMLAGAVDALNDLQCEKWSEPVWNLNVIASMAWGVRNLIFT